MINKIHFVWLLPVILFLPDSLQVCAQSKKDKVFQGLSPELVLGTIYDDNILKYSDYYLTKFLNGEDSGRFHINTSDGLIIEPSLKLTATFLFLGKNKTILEGNFDQKYYVNNKIKNWNKGGIELQQFIIKNFSINFSYYYLPQFYVRHYRDDDWVDIYGYTPETYQPFTFSKNEYGIWLQNSFFKKKNTRVRLDFDYAQYYYNEHFTEYDSKNLTCGFSLYQTIKKKLKLEIGYRFINSNANGYDEPDETKDDSDDSDPSSNEDVYSGSVRWAFKPVFRRSGFLDVDFTFRRNCYITKHYLETDRLHAGRFDEQYKLKICYEILLFKSLKMSVFYYWCKQDCDTKAEANKEFISQERDYIQHQYGLKFTYTVRDIKFSHSEKK
jgi:hypothetical protein